MFFFRRDQGLKRKMARRVKSPRGSAYLQLALVLPIVVMVISAMFEFTSFWDAKIMANHTAWTVGRIATVRAGLRSFEKVEKEKLISAKPSLGSLKSLKNTDGMYVATAMLMSTCSMGSMHDGDAGLVKDFTTSLVNGVRDGIKKMVTDAIKKQLDELKNNFSEYVTSSLGLVDGKIGDVVGKTIGKAVDSVFGWLLDNLLKPLIGKLADAVGGKVLACIPDSVYNRLGELLGENRQLRQIAYAIDRTARYDVVTVTERKDADMVFSGNAWGAKPDYPAVFDSKATSDDWMVTKAGGWPPNGQYQMMIDVKIRWPFERAWLFPILASAKSSSDPGDIPTAVGRALFYPQPAIFNENLASEGGKAYASGDGQSYADEIKKLKDQCAGFMHLVHFSYLYRLGKETVGPYDSESSFSGSYKGIGRGITGKAYKSAYHEKTGLVFWMDRAPDDTGSHKAWKSKSPPADYYACFRTLFGTGDEECLLFGVSEERLGRLEYCRYHAYEWFYWGDGSTLHRRHWHGTPDWLHVRSVHSPFILNTSDFLDDGQTQPQGTRFLNKQGFNYYASRFIREKRIASAVPCNEWLAFVQANADFTPCANAMTKMFCPNEAPDLVARENAVWEKMFGGRYDKFDFNKMESSFKSKASLYMKACEITKLVEDSERELSKLVGGKGGEVAYDDNDFFDFGNHDDEDVLKDPAQTIKKMKEKLAKMKEDVISDLRKVDAAEMKARNAYNDFEQALKDAGAKRRDQIVAWSVDTAAALAAVGPDASAVRAWLLKRPKQDYRSATMNIERTFNAYESAMDKLYEAELEMAQHLALKSAQRRTKKSIDTGLDDMKEITPAESSSKSGSDDDKLGDKWKRQTGKGQHGWVPSN